MRRGWYVRRQDEVVALGGGRGRQDLPATAAEWLGNTGDAGAAAAAAVRPARVPAGEGNRREMRERRWNWTVGLTSRWQSNVKTVNFTFSKFVDDQNASSEFCTRFCSKSAESASWSWGVRHSFSDIYEEAGVGSVTEHALSESHHESSLDRPPTALKELRCKTI
jgi:hypothetical protein